MRLNTKCTNEILVNADSLRLSKALLLNRGPQRESGVHEDHKSEVLYPHTLSQDCICSLVVPKDNLGFYGIFWTFSGVWSKTD